MPDNFLHSSRRPKLDYNLQLNTSFAVKQDIVYWVATTQHSTKKPSTNIWNSFSYFIVYIKYSGQRLSFLTLGSDAQNIHSFVVVDVDVVVVVLWGFFCGGDTSSLTVLICTVL